VLQLEIVLYFHENPETLDNARGLSLRLGILPPDVVDAMGDLVGAGVMEQSGQGDRAVYMYTRDPGVRAAVAECILNRCQTRRGRIELEEEILAGGSA